MYARGCWRHPLRSLRGYLAPRAARRFGRSATSCLPSSALKGLGYGRPALPSSLRAPDGRLLRSVRQADLTHLLALLVGFGAGSTSSCAACGLASRAKALSPSAKLPVRYAAHIRAAKNHSLRGTPRTPLGQDVVLEPAAAFGAWKRRSSPDGIAARIDQHHHTPRALYTRLPNNSPVYWCILTPRTLVVLTCFLRTGLAPYDV